MLEFVAAVVEFHDSVMVEAKLDGTPVNFFVAQDAIEDRLRLTGLSLYGCRVHLEENWGAFADGLERAIRSHGNDVVVSTDMLNP